MSAEDALAELEARVLAAAGVGGWLGSVEALRKLLAAVSPATKRIVLAMVAPKVQAEALAAVTEAFALGVEDARAIIGRKGGKPGKVTKSIRGQLKGLDAAGAKAVRDAVKLARSGADAETYLAPIFGHANTVQRTVTSTINAAGNLGSTRIAAAAGLPTVWVAETNACVHCLAYSGVVAPAGRKFPGGLTYGRKSYWPDKIKHPPLHPNCRCTIEPLLAQEYADALRREADRSVLRGFSLQSESMGVRLDAADRLVQSGVDAPKSVIAYARKSVKAGEFSTRGRPKA